MQKGRPGLKIPSRRERRYLLRISNLLINQKSKIRPLLRAGQSGHTREGQSGFRIRSNLLIPDLLDFFFSTLTFFCTSSSIVCIRIISITAEPTGLFISDATVVFRIWGLFCGRGAGGVCRPTVLFVLFFWTSVRSNM